MNTIQVTDTTFETEVSQSDKPVLVDFTAAWCPPCRLLGPVLDEIAAEHGERYKVTKVDVDANPKLAEAFKVRSLPTLMFVKDGQARDFHIGTLGKADIVKRLAALA
jgi:thioredoxin 1